MLFLPEEEAAIRAAGEKHGMTIGRRLFSLLVEKTRENMNKHGLPFVEARCYALNKYDVWEKKKRRAYNSALGAYFGKQRSLKSRKAVNTN